MALRSKATRKLLITMMLRHLACRTGVPLPRPSGESPGNGKYVFSSRRHVRAVPYARRRPSLPRGVTTSCHGCAVIAAAILRIRCIDTHGTSRSIVVRQKRSASRRRALGDAGMETLEITHRSPHGQRAAERELKPAHVGESAACNLPGARRAILHIFSSSLNL